MFLRLSNSKWGNSQKRFPSSFSFQSCSKIPKKIEKNSLTIKREIRTVSKGWEDTLVQPGISIKLSHLHDNKGSNYQYKRIGRGMGSGKGKTSGRGHKGHRARSGGGVHPSFEGGQSPLFKRMRKYGFSNKQFKIEYEEVNLSKLQQWIDLGRIDPRQTITMKTLLDTKCVSNIKQGVKLLGRGAQNLKQPIKIEISSASQSAVEGIKNKGGEVKTMYYNRLGLRFLLKPHKFQIAPARAAAPLSMRSKFDDWGQFTSPRYLKIQAQKEQQNSQK